MKNQDSINFPGGKLRPIVFIAGPISSSGEPGPNLHQAGKAAIYLLRHGLAPYIPHCTWIVDAIDPVNVRHWKRADLSFLYVSHAILRLPGHSVGADNEVNHAKLWGKLVFRSVEECVEYFVTRGDVER